MSWLLRIQFGEPSNVFTLHRFVESRIDKTFYEPKNQQYG